MSNDYRREPDFDQDIAGLDRASRPTRSMPELAAGYGNENQAVGAQTLRDAYNYQYLLKELANITHNTQDVLSKLHGVLSPILTKEPEPTPEKASMDKVPAPQTGLQADLIEAIERARSMYRQADALMRAVRL